MMSVMNTIDYAAATHGIRYVEPPPVYEHWARALYTSTNGARMLKDG